MNVRSSSRAVACACACLLLFPASAGAWRNVGPGAGGWVKTIVFSRHDPNRYFVGSDVNGFHRTDDDGKSYRIGNVGLDNLNIEEIAEHPTDPDTLYLAIEGGIYKTTDGGRTWKEKRNGMPPKAPSSYALSFADVVLAPDDPERVYACVGFRSGRKFHHTDFIFISDDGGEHWRSLVAGGTFEKGTCVLSLSIDPQNVKRMLAATSAGLFASADAGVHWARAEKGLPAEYRVNRVVRAPSDRNVVYAVLRAKRADGEWYAEVYRSGNGGDTWEQRSAGLEACDRGTGKSRRAASYNRLAVDPKDPDNIYIGGACYWTHILHSSDGGRSWNSPADKKLKWPVLGRGWVPSSPSPIGGALAISPFDSRKLAAGTDFTIFRSDDAGFTWQQRYTKDYGDGRYGSIGTEMLCVRQTDFHPTRRGEALFAILDVGCWMTTDGGISFSPRIPNFVEEHACLGLARAADNPELVWGVFGGYSKAPSAKRHILRSTDGGRTWNACMKGDPEWMRPRGGFISCLSGSAPYALGATWPEGLTVSFDGGENWELVSTNDLPIAKRVSALHYADGVAYAGSSAIKGSPASLWKSTDGGRSWSCVTSPELRFGNIVDIRVFNGRMLICANQQIYQKDAPFGQSGVYVSDDKGATWRNIYKGEGCRSTALSKGRILVSRRFNSYFDGYNGDGGVFMTEDDGKSWISLNDGSLHNLGVTHVAVDPFDEDVIWAATQGGSLFTRRLPREGRRDSK